MAIAPDLGLFYPYPRVFFVTRGNARLQTALLRGLKAARADGSLAALLAKTPDIGSVLSGEHALPKTLIGLPNPWLPPELQHLTPEQYHPAVRATLRALRQPARV